ncbi:MAG: hypothetical protein Fur0018_08660 [Anaerolineales bacterium]
MLTSPQKPRHFMLRWGVAACWVYFTLMAAWLILFLFSGDTIGLVGLITALAQFLFLPLPLILLLAWKTGRRELWGGAALGAVIFLSLWGIDFIPKSPARAASSLHIVTYNVLGLQGHTMPAIDVIHTLNADLVCLQEVTPNMAQALTQNLSEYPYQYLSPQETVFGMGILSKMPLKPVEHNLGDGWIGIQVFQGTFDKRPFLLVNFHLPAYTLRSMAALTYNFQVRNALAARLVHFTTEQTWPLVECGDANATPLSTAYRILQQGGLRDSWREAGWGFGNTFPGSLEAASSRPHLGRFPLLPRWSARIDYVLYTPEFRAVQAQVAPFDGVSDHRGASVSLTWR